MCVHLSAFRFVTRTTMNSKLCGIMKPQYCCLSRLSGKHSISTPSSHRIRMKSALKSISRTMAHCIRFTARWTGPTAMIALLFISSDAAPGSEIESPGLTVNGNPIVTARPVTRVGGEWFLPLLPIANAVGGQLQITAPPQQLNVRRSDGTTISYDSRTGEVRSQSVLIGRVKAFQQVEIVGLSEDLLFPLGGVVALLGVDIYEDTGRNLLVIQTVAPSHSRTQISGPFLNIGTVDYNYGMTTNGKDYGEYANMRGQILVGSIRTTENLILSGLQGPAASRVVQGWLRADLPRGQAITLGDRSTYSGIEAFT